MGIPFHPISNIFPLLEGEELDALAADIAEYGLRDPIMLAEDMILDGRNRYRACIKAGVEPATRNYCGDPSDQALTAYVVSTNLHRRHLTESQRAMVGAKLANMKHGGDRRSDQSANLPVEPVSAKDAADMLNVSERSVKTARKVQQKGTPELAAAVEKGEVSVSAAAVVADLPEEEQKAAVAAGPEAVKEKAKEVKHAEPHPVSDAKHYATMAISQLQRIRDDDPNARKELVRVSNWITERETDL